MKNQMARLGLILAAVVLGGVLGGRLAAGHTATAAQQEPGALLDSAPASGHQAAATVNACGAIVTDTTWTTGNVYSASNCYVTVAASATLTIEPGVVVKFGGACPNYGCAEGSVALRVDGALIASGTPAQPVVLTSLADDAHGGDTNGDGASVGEAGQWYGLVLNAGSRAQLEHVWIGYAGSGVFNADLGYGRAQVDVRGGDLQVRSSAIISGRQKGIYLEGDGITPVIQDVTIAGNAMADGRGDAIYQDSVNMQPAYGNLTLSGNDQDQVIIGNANEALSRDVTLGGANFGFRCGFTLCDLTVSNSTTLTIAPGTLLDFGPAYGIAVASGGALVAQGTAAQPITFTSRLTETGYWLGLWAQPGSTLRLDHCDISYAANTNYGKGGLEINTADAQVRNCRIHHNRDDGLYIAGAAGDTLSPRLENLDISDNGHYGVYLYNSGNSLAPTFEGGRISRNGWAGIRSAVWNGSPVILTLRNLTVSDNGSTGANAEDQAGLRLDHTAISPVFENLTLSGNTGPAIYWTCDGSITAAHLTASGNGVDAVVIPGCTVTSGRRWSLAEAGIPVHVTGNIYISQNALLSLAPGAALLFNADTKLQIEAGALYALGTADRPIAFTRLAEAQNPWRGIYNSNGTLILQHFELAYAGNQNYDALLISGDGSQVIIQNSRIHHSGNYGIYSKVDTPILRNNEFYSNTSTAVYRGYGVTPLDARYNWWGDPSGPYHPTSNPSGTGDQVSDYVLFDPWLTEPPTDSQVVSEMLVTTGGPRLVSPGQTTDYAIQYLNLMTSTVENAVLLLQLPQAAEYVDSTGGGIYWPERHQVFWKLGHLHPNAEDFVSVQVRFQWGLPADYTDGSITLLAADNYNVGQFNVAEYTAYQPVTAAAQTPINQAEFDALRAATPDLQTLYAQAIAQGYVYLQAGRVMYSDGTSVTGAIFRTPDRRWVRMLTLYEGHALAVTSGEGLYLLHDATGGMTTTVSTLSREYWGDWAADTGAQTLGANSPSACTPGGCKFNCIGKKITFKYVTYSLGQMFLSTIATGGGGGLISGAFHALHVTKMIYDCNNECNNDPNSNCCTAGQVRWTVSGWFKLFGSACVKEVCNGTTGTYGNPGTIYCTAGGQRCVAGYGNAGGCKDCTEGGSLYSEVRVSPCAPSANGRPRCSDLELLRAKDPNALYGPEGDLLPGQRVTYTITYENEGAGRAYGVHVINILPAVFNASTLELYGHGVYLPDTREIVWVVGELGPKGDPDSKGVITYTAQLTAGLPSGTVVSNGAVVYFPSVPEETPTNAWVNLVAPLVAAPQSLSTNYQTPLTLTLKGRDISGLPLTFELVDWPLGALAGAPPTLVYTPADHFVGVDDFTFRVSNGVTDSRPAQVRILVSAAGDTDAPQIVWNTPADGAQEVLAAAVPVFTDAQGPVYAPIILIGFSEALSATTVTSQTMRLESEAGIAPASVIYDGLLNQAALAPRTPLRGGSVYTVTVTAGVMDLAGNPLAAGHWSFHTAGLPLNSIYLPLVLRAR